MNRLRYLWGHHKIASLGFILAVALSLFFGARFVSRAIYWSDPAHLHQSPEAWMTPGYIARSWHLKIEEVDAILGIEDGHALVGDGRPTLERIAKAKGEPLQDLMRKLSLGLPKTIADKEARPPQ
ncbi:hypothetical protein DEM26_06630 [Thioclava sp. NG1]|uniref:hypothetical protein n=1 Tax=unclassified Thioclava TaxID=2621713 RepID=UPI000B539484|nr:MULTISPECIES: hypothetical protein [unclassified Thioclava]OWY15271.1 hypothetical protein B6V72_01350 [Thioclava sp. F34-6]PWE50578.1 hypothetical protein DEM26_06630 [Thioclava sp. NG1]